MLSTYDLGRQPFGLASAAAALTNAGVVARCADLSREALSESAVRESDLVAFFLPMHTATRLAMPVIDKVRAINPHATLCAYGLYAPLSSASLGERGVTTIIGGEFEDDLVEFACRTLHMSTSHAARRTSHVARSPSHVARVRFHVPLRESLPPLARYATLQHGDARKIVGYTEASRGCKHRCRHCPIVPVYDGHFRVVPLETVLEDIRRQVSAGAQHITFGDPDFFNGPKHAVALVRRLATEFPGLSYDVTIKVEHLIQQAPLLQVLSSTGCAFVTSAVESVDEAVLARLEKGHTAADFERAVGLCRSAGLVMAPTFVAFTPWTTLAGYCELLQAIDRLELVEHVAPIQLAIRLLIPERSRLLELDDIRGVIRPFDHRLLTYPWAHETPAVDRLQESIVSLVGRRLNASRSELFAEIWRIAHDAAAIPAPARQDRGVLPRAAIPYLNEPWYC